MFKDGDTVICICDKYMQDILTKDKKYKLQSFSTHFLYFLNDQGDLNAFEHPDFQNRFKLKKKRRKFHK